MVRNLMSWTRSRPQSRRLRGRSASRRRARRRGNQVHLAVERLEDRWLLTAGSLDTTFGVGGVVVDDLGLEEKKDEQMHVSAIQQVGGEDRILVAGLVKLPSGAFRDVVVARYHADGTRDTSFGTDGFTTFEASDIANRDDGLNDLLIDSEGRIIAVGSAATQVGSTIVDGVLLVRLTPSGQVDTDFGDNGKVITVVTDTSGSPVSSRPSSNSPRAVSAVFDDDGRILVGTTANMGTFTTQRDFVLLRFDEDGSLDEGFGVGGIVTTDFFGNHDRLNDLAIQDDGKIVAVGSTQTGVANLSDDFAVVRYHSDGSLDTSFGDGGKVNTNIVVTGDFPQHSQDFATSVVIEGDGSIVVGGYANVRTSSVFNNTARDMVLAKYDAHGALDTSFGPASDWTSVPGTVRINFNEINVQDFEISFSAIRQPDGPYLIGGSVAPPSSTERVFAAARVLPSGALDTSFGTDGRVQTPLPDQNFANHNHLLLQPDGKLLSVGYVSTIDGDFDIAMVRYETGLELETNVPPTLTLSGDASVEEGAVYTLGLSSFDPDEEDEISHWTINWGDGTNETVPGDPSSVTHVYADGPASYVISATATDNTGTYEADNTISVSVLNVAPTATFANDGPADEGSTATVFFANQFDPSPADTSAGFRYAYDFNDDGLWNVGDGSYVGSVDAATQAVPAGLLEDGPAVVHVRGRIIDQHGDFTEYTTVIEVLNVPPAIDDATFELVENSPIGTVVGSLTATDPGIHDELSFSIVGGSGADAFAIEPSDTDPRTAVLTVADATMLDFETSPVLTVEVEVGDGDGGFDAALVTVELLNQPSIFGVVFIDVNENGQFDADEPGIDDVTIHLLDEHGEPALDVNGEAIQAITSGGGFFLFEDLDPGTYEMLQEQPTGVEDGYAILGTIDGETSGEILHSNRIRLELERIDAFDYAFAELGQQVSSGDAAGIGFWQNKNGRELITQGGTDLADWLTTTFPNVFGDEFVGADGSDVAEFYRDQLFRQKGKKSAGPAKIDAQFMATALATFFTSSNLAGEIAASYNFTVTDTGIGTRLVNVGTSGAAFNVDDGTDLTIMQLLLATNDLTNQDGVESGFAAIYDLDGDGELDQDEAALRAMAFEVYSEINVDGGI